MLEQQIEAVDQTEQVLIINEDIQIIEYAPKVFAYLRKLDNIDLDFLKESLSPDANRESVFKAGESQGKSGSFFFFSHDKNFIIKTMTDNDLKTFKSFITSYFKRIDSNPQESLLARIYGVYTIKMEEVEPVHLILMGNTKKSNDKNIVHVFDLKGSMINREVFGENLKNTATLKDINLLNLKNKNLLQFREEDQVQLMKNLKKDAKMLRDMKIMDYSLLLAIEKNPDFKDVNGTMKK